VESSFPRPGEYPMLCNEYCGLGHDHMWSKAFVIDKEEWEANRAARHCFTWVCFLPLVKHDDHNGTPNPRAYNE
jgi:heme/copper-type cytochrome/quinol oxidase subunit 2